MKTLKFMSDTVNLILLSWLIQMYRIPKELVHRVSQETKVKTQKAEAPMSLESCGGGNRYIEYSQMI